MNIFLDESRSRQNLFPFTLTRHVADLRIGILTIRQKWELLTGLPICTDPALRNTDSIVVHAHIIPTAQSVNQIMQAAKDETPVLENDELRMLHWPWHIFQYNDWALRHDFESLTAGRTSAPLPASNNASNPAAIFIEEGAVVEHCILNASTGPIYIAADAVIMEGALIRGPFAAAEGATVKMGAKIYGATTLGPYCVAGGEIKNSVMFGYSNKAHDGYLGDSVLGEWCNLGAGTSNSNVKNTAGMVKYYQGGDTEGQEAGNKAGLLMGDYSRCAINTSFNTGTVVGVCCNIFGSAPSRYVPHFAWGSERYIFHKAIRDINNWKQMKGQTVTAEETELLQTLYLTTP